MRWPILRSRDAEIRAGAQLTALLAFLPHSAHVTQWEVTPEEGIVRCDLTSLEWVFVFANDADLLGVVWGNTCSTSNSRS